MFLKTILDINVLLIIVGILVSLIKTLPIMIEKRTNRLDLDIVFHDKWLGFFTVIIIINFLSYFFLREEYIKKTTNELKLAISQNDSLFFSPDRIYLDSKKIYPSDMNDRYTDEVYSFVLSNNKVIYVKKFRNDSTKYGIEIINQYGMFNHDPIAIFKLD